MNSTPPAGWYPDPAMTGGQRYWDGSAWTEHRKPPPAPLSGAFSGSRNLAMWAHLGALVVFCVGGGPLGFVPPLVIMSVKGDTDPYVREHARESLNFQLSLLLYCVVAFAAFFAIMLGTMGLGLFAAIPVALVLVVLVAVVMVLASVAASQGRPYRYPATIRFVK